MAGKARGPEGTVQFQTWRLLVEQGPMTQPQIRDITGRSRKSVDNCVRDLIIRGCVEVVGTWPKSVYRGIPGAAPDDLRPLNHRHLPKDGRNLPRPYFGSNSKGNWGVVKSRREGTSSEIPQIPPLAALLLY